MRDATMVSLLLSNSDFKYLQDISNRFGLKKSEFLRLLIQSLKISEAVATKKGTEVQVGGYGIEFSPETLQSFAEQIEALFEGVGKGIKITYVKTKAKPKKSRMKPVLAVA